MKDTIAAISTSLAEAAIGIVRLSGEQAIPIAKSLFQGASSSALDQITSHSLVYGFVVDPQTGEQVDEALFTVMRQPRSYTKEDVVEINCHGGIQALKRTLEIVLQQGARMAEPGEFTKRAFLNGRLDLAQAEAVIDLVKSPGARGLKLALSQLEGRFSAKMRKLQDTLLDLRADLEAAIDFPEEDIEPATKTESLKTVEECKKEMEGILEQASEGMVYRYGIETAIVGRPNVGKSSILNALLKEERAIVTALPGTTRDIIEEIVTVRGIPLRLRDTAGIREPENQVEEIGIGLSKKAIARASLVLCVFDQSAPLAPEDRELVQEIKEKKAIAVVNKIDLPCRLDEQELKRILNKVPAVRTAALSGEGLSELEEAIEKRIFEGRSTSGEDAAACNLRHQQALEKARDCLKEAGAALREEMSEEIVCCSISGSLDALGEILGETTTEDLLDRIFSKFCLGK